MDITGVTVLKLAETKKISTNSEVVTLSLC
jgi:hypothetical protein